MSISNEQGLSRRRFLQGAGLAAASVAAAGMMAGCAATGGGETLGDTGAAPRTYDPAETMDVDIVVVGSGASAIPSRSRYPRTWASLSIWYLLLSHRSFLYGRDAFSPLE